MPGAMRKMGVYLGLVEDDDTLGDGAEAYERVTGRGEHGAAPRGDRSEFGEARYGRVERGPAADRAESVHVVAREWSEPEAGYAGEFADEYALPPYRITTLHPRTYNEARTIGEHFRSSTPVIMNLSEMGRRRRQATGRLRRRADLRVARADRAGHRQGLPAQPEQRHGYRAGQGPDRRGRLLQPELRPGSGTSPQPMKKAREKPVRSSSFSAMKPMSAGVLRPVSHAARVSRFSPMSSANRAWGIFISRRAART